MLSIAKDGHGYSRRRRFISTIRLRVATCLALPCSQGIDDHFQDTLDCLRAHGPAKQSSVTNERSGNAATEKEQRQSIAASIAKQQQHARKGQPVKLNETKYSTTATPSSRGWTGETKEQSISRGLAPAYATREARQARSHRQTAVSRQAATSSSM